MKRLRLTRTDIAHLPITPLSKALLDDYERRQLIRRAVWTVVIIAVAEIVRLVVM